MWRCVQIIVRAFDVRPALIKDQGLRAVEGIAGSFDVGLAYLATITTTSLACMLPNPGRSEQDYRRIAPRAAPANTVTWPFPGALACI